jgi:hypothetical protein
MLSLPPAFVHPRSLVAANRVNRLRTLAVLDLTDDQAYATPMIFGGNTADDAMTAGATLH